MIIELYIETSTGIYESLDLYEDEKILINYKLKDSNDIAKVFSTYSQTLTIPSTPNNNVILNYYFNSDIVTPSKSRYLNGKIYVNKQLFKVGKFVINEGKYKRNILDNYNINFFTGTATLKDKFGETLLSDLTNTPPDGAYYTQLPEAPLTWTRQVAFDLMYQDTLVGPNYDVFVPLISNKRLLTYNTTYPSDIKWVNSSTTLPKALSIAELRPAIKYSKIMDNIISSFGLNIECPLFTRPEYTDLYIHLTTENITSVQRLIGVDTGAAFSSYLDIVGSPSFTWNISVNSTTNIFTITRTTPFFDQSGRFRIKLYPVDLLGSDTKLSAKVRFIDKRSATNGTILAEVVAEVDSYGFLYATLPFGPDMYDFGYGGMDSTHPLYFKVEAIFNSVVTWATNNPVAYRGVSFFLEVSGTGFRYRKWILYNSDNDNNYNINLNKMIPDMKVSDFMTSFFKMFNISVVQNNTDDLLFVLAPQDFTGVEKDFTQYTDNESSTLKPQSVFSKYNFKHTTSKYYSNIAFVKANINNVNQKEYGQLISAPANVTTQNEYLIETKYSIVPTTTIVNTDVLTQYGFDSDSPVDDSVYGNVSSNGGKYKPVTNEMTLFYINKATGLYKSTALTDSDNNAISFGFRSDSSTLKLQRYYKVSIVNNDDQLLYSNSLGFKDEVNEIPSVFIYGKNLYSNYYGTHISKITAPNRFINSFKCILPPKEINEFTLVNTIIIGNNKYAIEDVTIDITTGETTLSLINY